MHYARTLVAIGMLLTVATGGQWVVEVDIGPRLTVNGPTGSQADVLIAPSLGGPWTFWTNVTVNAEGMVLSDLPPGTDRRFYRAVATQTGPFPSPTGLVWIEGGSFLMGSPSTEVERFSNENRHEVVLTRGFFIGRYEVTQSEYELVMGTNPSQFKGPNLPVERVSWIDATNYCARLTTRERSAGRLPDGWAYWLPTEAQWEYACRAETTTATAFGDSLSSSQADFDGNFPYSGGAKGPYLRKTTSVGSYTPNAWGLHDMHGNVWEWCADWNGNYPMASVEDPLGPATGFHRIFRGGGWNSPGYICRSAIRRWGLPGDGSPYQGFRIALIDIR